MIAKFEDWLLRVAVGLPLAVAITGTIAAWAHGFTPRQVRGAAFTFVASLVFARYFYLRSKDREATFIVTRVSPTDPRSKKRAVDQLMMVGAAAYFVVVVVVPWL